MIGVFSLEKWTDEDESGIAIAKKIATLSAKINSATRHEQMRQLMSQKTALEKKLKKRSKAYF